ncbi:aminotransferase class IV [Labilibacter marinus]|uniref:aminotransferase class IV n=1 Tax=Labilibacter marinus TaxID=1477105 RepID=UPI00094FC56A|nr:aminotransferase class IV [Labilibacter marinus]
MSDFVSYNGKVYPVNQVPITFNNRAFKYGDAIFETIRCSGHYPLHFQLHYKRLIKAMMNLKMDISSLPRQDELEQLIVKLLQKEKSFGASRVRLQVFRDGEGLYTPNKNTVNVLVESSKLVDNSYVLNEKGLLVGTYPEMKKQYSPISFFKNGNSLQYVLAASFKKENAWDDCLLLNDKGLIIEANSSNLFWIKDGLIFTPSVYSACVDGVMRKVLVSMIKERNIANVIEVQGASEDDLLAADEVFISNAIQGIQWVVGFKDKRYFCQLTKTIHQALNEYTYK